MTEESISILNNKPASPRENVGVSGSIRWQTFGAISFVMLVLAILILSAIFQLSETRFETSRNAVHEQYEKQLERLIETSAERQIQLSGAVTLNRTLMESIAGAQLSNLESEIEELDWNLQADVGISVRGLFDPQGQSLYRQGQTVDPTWVQSVLSQEVAKWQVVCEDTCYVVSYSALLYRGNVSAVLVLAEPLSNVMLRFKHVAGIDTGLLVESAYASERDDYVPAWGRSLRALTNPSKNQPILNRAAAAYSLSDLTKGIQLVDIGGQVYELKASGVGTKNAMTSQIVVISNVSEDYSVLDQSQDQTLKLSIAALFVGEILLLLLLWRPLKKIGSREAGEMDMLEQGAILQSTSLALEQARNFSDSITDSLSAAVLVVDHEGKVRSCNRYLLELLALSSAQISKQELAVLVNFKDRQFEQRLSDLRLGIISEYEVEGEVQAFNHDRYRFTWRFTRVYDLLDEGTQSTTEQGILVTGTSQFKALPVDEQNWRETHDSLTGVLNQNGLIEALQSHLDNGTAMHGLCYLLRLPDVFLDKSPLSYRLIAELVEEFKAILKSTMSTDGSSIEDETAMLARLDPNEIVLCFWGQDSSSTDGLMSLLIDRANSVVQLKAGVTEEVKISQSRARNLDRYALNVIQRLRTGIS